MNLKHLTDHTLLNDTEKAAHQERRALSVVLHHIREVDRRRLYSTLKCQSLAEYMVKHLKYTENEAWPRIGAMNLLKEIPEIESKINDGTLSLTNLNMVNRALKQEVVSRFNRANVGSDENHALNKRAPRTVSEKRELLSKIENATKREAEVILRRETGVVLKASESHRELSDGSFELKSVVSKNSVEVIEKLKGRFAHSHPGLTTGQLLELALATLDKSTDPVVKAQRLIAARPVPEKSKPAKSSTRYIPAAVRHAVWMRDGGRCTNCKSARAVEFEHVLGVALGGDSTVENLKLLCRSCNQRTAIEAYGIEKMSSYLGEAGWEYVMFTRDRLSS